MWEFLAGFLLGCYAWMCWKHPRTRAVAPGLNKKVVLPHRGEVELHHNALSSCSQKVRAGGRAQVRACLGETGLPHTSIHHTLPSSGGWETKGEGYLRDVNPAGTVPVLLHHGHPVYESHEQIIYIDQVLMPGGPRLTPTDPEKGKLMDKWVDYGAMIISEVDKSDPWPGVTKRMGNMLGPMTLPLFVANITVNFSLWNTLESISMLPLVNGNSILFIILNVAVRLFGVKVFQRLGPLGRLVSLTRRALYHHLTELTKVLELEGPYICGEQYTLADISMVPILERMEVARWWTKAIQADFPLVCQYWDRIQQRDGYKASKMVGDYQVKMDRAGAQVDMWKKEHPWFNAYFEGQASDAK